MSSTRYGKATTKKAPKEKQPARVIPLGPVPTKAPTGTLLVRYTISAVGWLSLNATARRMLRVPLAWAKRKGVEMPARLRWVDVAGQRRAWMIAGSAPAAELAAVLSAAGVEASTEAFKHQLRRIPMGAILTDPAGNGVRAEIETTGMPVLARDRKGRWRLYSIASGASWPEGAPPALGDHVAGVEGFTAPPPWAAARYAIEEGIEVATIGSKRSRTRWERRTMWSLLSEATAEMERAAVADMRVNRTARWRAVDVGSGTVRAETKRGKKGLKRVDYAPGPKSERGTITVVAVPTGAP